MDLSQRRRMINLTTTGSVGHLYIVAGAGGTGARLAQMLPRIVGAGDAVVVCDPDRVEARNVLRQHFTTRDVGANKAELVAARILAALPAGVADQVYVTGVPYTVQEATQRGIITAAAAHGVRVRELRTVLLGCVDNPTARRYAMVFDHPLVPAGLRTGTFTDGTLPWDVYIDAGNTLRNGQVCLSLQAVPMRLGASCYPYFPQALRYVGDAITGVPTPAAGLDCTLTFSAIRHYAPTLLLAEDADTTEPCAVRMDTQTPAVNLGAAFTMFCMLTAVVDQLPIASPFVEFCTNPQLMTAEPWPALHPAQSLECRRGSVGLFPYLPFDAATAPDATEATV